MSNTQAWLKDARKRAGFDVRECVQALTEFFSTVLAKVKSEYAAVQEDERMREETLTAESGKLVALLEQFKQVEAALEAPLPGLDVDQARALSRELTKQIQDQEKVVDMLDGGADPDETDMGDDPIADSASVVAVPDDTAPERPPRPSAKDLWPESNYQDYAARVSPLFPTPTGKMPLESLFLKMEEPVDSKLYLPRPLELYTAEELVKVVPKGLPRWNNRYEDPMEPAKSWSWDEFSEVYNKPGFHFMIARVAQVGPQYKDPKLGTLRGKLAARWRCMVTLQKMDPRQDWMLCTVPSQSDGEAEALKYDLIRLSEGNAVYVIRKFAPAGRARDLEWVVKGSLADDNTIYNQMRKQLLDFEMGETRLGWRVLGVRKAGATSKFRGTFILDSPTTYWPWSMDWGHKHGSVPDSSPLLNFEPTWSARRPYACQCCYSTDHFTEECPLPFMKVGGNSLVSQPARTLVIKKKAAERIISLDRSSWELPVPPAPGTPRIPPSPSRPLPRAPLAQKIAPMSVIEERSTALDADNESSAASDVRMSIAAPPLPSDPPYQVVDDLIKFLLLQLAGSVSKGLGLMESKVQFLCKSHKGSLPAVLASLRQDGWILASVSDQVMSFKYERFLKRAPSPMLDGWCISSELSLGLFANEQTSLTHNCLGPEPNTTQGAAHQVTPAGETAVACTKKLLLCPLIEQPLTRPLDQTPAMLQAVQTVLPVPPPAHTQTEESKSHVSDTPLPEITALSQNTAGSALRSPICPPSQEVPISPTKAVKIAVPSQQEDKQTTEYTWPDSLLDVEMMSGSELEHTTLLPDKGLDRHPAVQTALTSLALGRTVEQDGEDIMSGVPLPIISAPLLPSLVPLDEEESLLFSGMKPLQGAALVRAAGITEEDVAILPKRTGKQKSSAWTIAAAPEPASGQITPHTQEPQYDTKSTSDTYEDLPFSQNLKRLVSAFPTLTEEHLSFTLEKQDNDLPTAMAWAQSMAEMKHIRSTLISAYPSAGVDKVESAVKRYKGDFLLSFNYLGLEHEPTDAWSEFAFIRRKGVMDIGEEAAEVIYDDPAARSFENQWWRTCVQIRRHRVAHSQEADRLWSKLAPIAVVPRPISLRFLQYVNNLGKYHTDRPRFKKAVGVLRAQDEFEGLVMLIGEPRPYFDGEEANIPAVAILHILVGDGLASPAAATWLALSVFKDRSSYDSYIPLFYGFLAVRRKLWNDRNIYMAASVKTISRQGSASGSKVDTAAARDTYMSAVPGTIKYALEKQREKAVSKSPKKKTKADKSSAGSKGSKRSRRIRGISPGGSIPEEEEEQEDPVGDAPA